MAQGTPLGVMKQTGRAGSLGRVDTCVSMAESLGCSPETITLLMSNSKQKASKKRWSVYTTYETITSVQCMPDI